MSFIPSLPYESKELNLFFIQGSQPIIYDKGKGLSANCEILRKGIETSFNPTEQELIDLYISMTENRILKKTNFPAKNYIDWTLFPPVVKSKIKHQNIKKSLNQIIWHSHVHQIW